MSNDDFPRNPDDEAPSRPSDGRDGEPLADTPDFPEFGELPGFTPLPDLAPLPELAPLPDFDDFFTLTPPADEAITEQAQPEGPQEMDLLAGLAPLPELAPQPAIAQPLTEEPTAPDDEKESMESGVAWPEAEEAPARDVRGAAVLASTSVSAFELLPDEATSEEPQPASRDVASIAAATASSRRTSEGDRTPTALRAPAPEPSRTWVDKTAVKRKPSVVMIVLGCILALNVAVSLFSPSRSGSSSTPSSHQTSSSASAATNTEVREHAANLPARAPGYRGSATNTHSISPQWSSGVATAWSLELPPEMTRLTPNMFVDGQVLYIAATEKITGQSGSTLRVVAYDLSGEEPSLLWDTVGPTENPAIVTYEPAFLSNETQLFFHDVVIDKATGEHSQAPWGIEIPLAQAEGIVVTCTPPSTCNGWTQASGEWTNLWTTTTIAQASYALRAHGLGYAPTGTTLSGTGTRASVLAPTSYQKSPQIINIHTGETTTLPTPDQSGLGQYVEVATDGFVIVDISQQNGLLLDSSGALQSTFSTAGYRRLPAVSRDGNQPSTADIKTFMTTKTANWATGTVSLVGEDDCSIEVTLTSDGSTHKTPVPGVLSQHMTSSCYFEPKEVRVSADASVLYTDTFTYQDEKRYFIDTVNGHTYSSNLLNLPKKTMWVFDDMMIGLTDSGLTAFVPASS